MRPSPSRIPSLDGLRAFSIALVLLGHLGGTRGFPLSQDATSRIAIADLGVRMFFVISGFLITGLLIDEQARSGRIALGRFYLRRTFRISPAYYAFLAAMIVAGLAGWVDAPLADIARAATYTSNYDFDRVWVVGHTWSLSVEEQFYLLWPALLLWLGLRRALGAALALVLLSPVVRLGLWYFVPSWHAGIGHTFETIGGALAMGCLLAGCRERVWSWRPYRALLESRWFVLVPVVLLAVASLHRPRILFAVGYTVMNVGLVMIVDWCVRRPGSIVGTILNWRPIAWVGTLSYSLYLWQQPFLNRYDGGAHASFPVNLGLAVVAALLSYYLVEQPALRLRRRLEERGNRTTASSPSTNARAPSDAPTPVPVDALGSRRE